MIVPIATGTARSPKNPRHMPTSQDWPKLDATSGIATFSPRPRK